MDKEVFDEARCLYRRYGAARGLDTEFKNFKRHRDWKEALPLLKPAIEAQAKWRQDAEGFVPLWKNFPTWINQRWWEFEPAEVQTSPQSSDRCCLCGKEASMAASGKSYCGSVCYNQDLKGEPYIR